MKVKELVERLQKCDPEKPVRFDIDDGSERWFAIGYPELESIEETEHWVLLDIPGN